MHFDESIPSNPSDEMFAQMFKEYHNVIMQNYSAVALVPKIKYVTYFDVHK